MTATEQLNDTQLRAAVIAELEWTPNVNSTRIGVAVVDGAVLLSGQVETYPEKNLAERATLRVRGVTCVAQELSVDGEWLFLTDIEIARQASRALAGDVGIPPDCVHALVDAQEITLSGSVWESSQREAADRAVRYIKGVVNVVNLISVRPAVTAPEITSTINAALVREAQLGDDGIVVTVAGGAVTLEGTVDSWPERRQADAAAWSAPGVTSVLNRLLIRT